MFTNCFLLVISMLSLLLLSLVVVSPLSSPPRLIIEPATRSLDAYYQSERALANPNAGLAIYQRSERTLVNPQAGMVTYHNSERTRVPVHFTKYQLSEWFGK